MVEQCASDGAEARGYFEAVAHELMRLRAALSSARTEALEEAAQWFEQRWLSNDAEGIAIAIRALKDKS